MSTQADDVLRAALSLDPNDRAEIVASLIASLDQQKDDDIDVAWADEIRSRIEEIDAGKVRLIPSEEVMGAMHERLNG